MTTRELIEAVHRVESFMGSPSVNGVRIPTACVRSTDYDALCAALVAVLDEVDEAMSFLLSSDVTDKQCLRARDNARALRERVKG